MELVSRRRSPPASSPAGAPHAFLSVFLGIRFSRFPGRLAPRPAASFRPRRKEIYYATSRLPSRTFFKNVLSGFEVPPFLLSIKLSERRNPRSPQTRGFLIIAIRFLPPQDLFLHELDELSFANLQDAILQLLGLNVVCLRRDRIAVELYATAIDEAARFPNALRKAGVVNDLREIDEALFVGSEVGRVLGDVVGDVMPLEHEVKLLLGRVRLFLVIVSGNDVAGEGALLPY